MSKTSTQMLHVGKVVLSDDCIEALEKLQCEKNDEIERHVRALTTAALMLSMREEDMGSRLEAKKPAIAVSLTEIIEVLENISAPVNSLKRDDNG